MRKSVSKYLKTVYEASYGKSGTNNKQIATLLGVLPGSVTEAIGNLAKMGLVTRQTYHEIKLTKAGYRIVQDLMFRYRLCEVWLAKSMQLSLTAIPEQAWLMAAIDNQDLLQRLNEQLGTPKKSPFGGAVVLPAFNERHATACQALSQVTVGQTVELVSYLETESLIKYWQHTNLSLNQQLTVTNQSATIPVITLTDQQQNEYMVDAAVANYLYVQPVKAQPYRKKN